ncbi:Pre-mRNA-splicing factor ATP-dependent RNA helicase [Venturia nashicola]|uniref:Signal peptidase complex subunit 2 n=1 Tax=Venturia nashicola TaxID=86259 RepID=A0A4Z1NKT5_9PEZI|nr:Pre-mRNA-splicing factor ATP-dependent RNA helicase [Venturia nashicola]TLD24538.1 Pre-mRNA-splicing factor ATP-dependent RNA helicase [Venturia nashicola]
MSQGKIAVYSVPDLKNTTDDALPNYLTSLKFTPNYQIQDVKLALGYTAVVISAALFYADWKLGWDQTKPYTLPAVVVYFILNGLFTYWIFYVEKGAIFVGEKGDTKITIATHAKKFDPTYQVTVTTVSKKSPSKTSTLKISAPFSRWFTSDGLFTVKPFQQFLASSVPEIGKADPNNVVEEIGRGSEAVKPLATSRSVQISANDMDAVLRQL